MNPFDAPYTKQEDRLLAFFHICTDFGPKRITEELNRSERQLPFMTLVNFPVARSYSIAKTMDRLLRLPSVEDTLCYTEMVRLENKIPRSWTPSTIRKFIAVYMDKLYMPFLQRLQEIKQDPSTAKVFADTSLDALEHLFWSLRRTRKILGEEPSEPRSWSVVWLFYLVDSWRELKSEDGGLETNGKVRNYASLAAKMNGKAAYPPAPFTASDVKKGEAYAIKFGFLRNDYADEFIALDGPQLDVVSPILEPVLSDPPGQIVLPPISQLGLTLGESVSYPAFVGMQPEDRNAESEDGLSAPH
ncbi:hypothetical protein MMC18_002541 [Xylographa bjoerkii]|nr:hypothetical protein [Xylographa bjoerkii]